MGTVLLVVHLLVAIFLVTLILMQRSEGGLGGGSGASSLLSARGTGNMLTRLTAILATVFFLTSISLSIYYKGAQPKPTSILEQAPAAQTVPAAPSAPVAGK